MKCGITVGMMNDEDFSRFSDKFFKVVLYFMLFMGLCMAFNIKLCAANNEAALFVTSALKTNMVNLVVGAVVQTRYPGFRVFDELSILCWTTVIFVDVGSLLYNILSAGTA